MRYFSATTALIAVLVTSACEHSPPPRADPVPAQPLHVGPQMSSPRPPTSESSPTGLTEYFGRGDDGPVEQPVTRSGGTARIERGGSVTLAFADADARKVVEAILGRILRVSYSIDPKVTGTITLRTAHPVAVAGLVPALETALATIDAALVIEGNSYRVVPRAVALSSVGLTRAITARDRAQPGFALEIVPLRYASAKEIEKVIDSTGGKASVLQVDEARNQLIISGSSGERASVRRLVASLDVDWVSGAAFAIYKLTAVAPDDIVSDLDQIFQPPLDGLRARVRLVPLPRINALLGVALRRSDLRQMESWIRRLDARGGGATGRQLFVYNVQNGRAADLANSLSQVIGGGLQPSLDAAGGLPPSPGNNASRLGFEPVTSDASRSGLKSPANSSRLDAPAAQFGQPTSRDTDPARRNSQLAPGSLPQEGDRLRIVPSEENNSLLIFATPTEYAFVMEALAKLDTLPRQVLIEAVLAEVSLSDDQSYGLQWSFTPGDNQITLSDSGSGLASSSFPGFSYIYSGTSSVRVVLNALQSRSRVRVLSAPKLIVLNNQTATLQVGDQVPIVTQQQQGIAAPGAPVVNTVELRDTGVILKVTPRVNESGLVLLDVSQEVSNVTATTTSGINSPTIQQRKLTSSIAAQSGTTIVLGGLIRNDSSRGRSGVPLLSQIPVLGSLFGKTTTKSSRSELVILLTPTVMRDSHETDAVVNDLIDEFPSIKPLVTKQRPNANR